MRAKLTYSSTRICREKLLPCQAAHSQPPDSTSLQPYLQPRSWRADQKLRKSLSRLSRRPVSISQWQLVSSFTGHTLSSAVSAFSCFFGPRHGDKQFCCNKLSFWRCQLGCGQTESSIERVWRTPPIILKFGEGWAKCCFEGKPLVEADATENDIRAVAKE